MVPETQPPLPVQFWPPHCEYFGSVPDTTVEVVATLETVEVARVVPEAVVPTADVELPPEEETTTPPGPATDVVKDPLSIYTPLK